MQEKIRELLHNIGRPYQMFNDDGTYQGCFYPVQFLYPDKPRYKLRSVNDEKNYWYGLSKIKKHCTEIPPTEPCQAGDIIVTKFRDELHVAIYWEYGKIIHVFRNYSLQTGRLKMFKNYKVFRVNT
ncbi:MAG: hypothetical protein K6C94_09030 [Candidatus Gastranaerophilales bacterium]|nr:hypothetical protein [Candidatus Gastranaerophilales bacterium]